MSLAEIRKQTLALALQKSKANRTAVKKTLTDERILDFYRIEEGEEIKVGTEVKWSDGTEVEDGKYSFKSGEEVTVKDSKVTEYKGLEESETEAESEDVEERAEELAIEILEEEKETMADEIAKVIDDAVDEAVELAVTEVQKDIIALRAENEKLTKKLEAVTKPKKRETKKSASGSQYASTKTGKDIDSLLAGAAKFRNRFKK